MKSHDKRNNIIYFQIKIGCYLHVIFQKSYVDKVVMFLEIKMFHSTWLGLLLVAAKERVLILSICISKN